MTHAESVNDELMDAVTVVDVRVSTGNVNALFATLLLAVTEIEPATNAIVLTPELPTKIDDVKLILEAFRVRPISIVPPSMRTPLSPCTRIYDRRVSDKQSETRKKKTRVREANP